MQTHVTKQSLITRILTTVKDWFRKPAPPAPSRDAIEELQRILTRNLYEGEG